MSWTYKSFKSNGESSLATAMVVYLNTLSAKDAATAKVIMANSSDADPFGAIYHYINGTDHSPTVAGSWASEAFQKGNREDLFNEALAALNDLPLQRALATQMTLTNKSSGSPRITLFIPSSAN